MPHPSHIGLGPNPAARSAPRVTSSQAVRVASFDADAAAREIDQRQRQVPHPPGRAEQRGQPELLRDDPHRGDVAVWHRPVDAHHRRGVHQVSTGQYRPDRGDRRIRQVREVRHRLVADLPALTKGSAPDACPPGSAGATATLIGPPPMRHSECSAWSSPMRGAFGALLPHPGVGGGRAGSALPSAAAGKGGGSRIKGGRGHRAAMHGTPDAGGAGRYNAGPNSRTPRHVNPSIGNRSAGPPGLWGEVVAHTMLARVPRRGGVERGSGSDVECG